MVYFELEFARSAYGVGKLYLCYGSAGLYISHGGVNRHFLRISTMIFEANFAKS